jgi:hypothetical protein
MVGGLAILSFLNYCDTQLTFNTCIGEANCGFRMIYRKTKLAINCSTCVFQNKKSSERKRLWIHSQGERSQSSDFVGFR